jgi:hypothetical protein
LEGSSRAIVGQNTDPDYFYKNLVLDTEKGLTTGYLSPTKNNRFGFWFTREEMERVAAGQSDQIPAVWGAKDEIQQRLVKTARTLPYALPAMYAVQKGITDPLFGRNEKEKKVNWYNPVDVIADFAKQSVINTFSVIAPSEIASGALSTARRALNTRIYSGADTAFNQSLRNRYVDLNAILSGVGTDLGKVTNKVVRTSTQFSYAFNSASRVARLDSSGANQAFSRSYKFFKPGNVESSSIAG